MLLIEADGKSLFRGCGIAVPAGVMVDAGTALPAIPGDGPWIVKAQVPVGGRGKAAVWSSAPLVRTPPMRCNA